MEMEIFLSVYVIKETENFFPSVHEVIGELAI